MKPKQIISTPEQAAFPAALDYSQKQIANLLADRPDAYLPDNKVLNQIIDGELTQEELAELELEPWGWFEDFLAAVDWWRALADVTLESGESPTTTANFGPRPQFAEHRKALSMLLRGLVNAYVDAQQESSPYNQSWGVLGPATFELLRRYRSYTRYVESFVLEVFPDINQDLLLRPDYGFICGYRVAA